MNYTLKIDLVGAEKTDAALDNLIKKVGAIGKVGVIDFSMDKAIDQSGILKSGEKAADGFKAGFSGKMRGYDATFKDLWKSIMPQAPDFMQDPGFFTRGKPGKPGQLQGPDLDGKMRKRFKLQQQEDAKRPKEMIIGAIATMFNPFVGSMMLSNAMSKKNKDGSIGSINALSYGEVFVIVKSLSIAFETLRKSVMAANAAYAKSLSSGLGLGFTVKRGMLADIMGVSETEVVKFGKQMEYLNPRIEQAANILAKTAVPLTQVSWEFKILGKDAEALFAKLSEQAAPAMIKFAGSIDILVKSLTGMTDLMDKAWNVSKWLQPLYLFHRATQAMANTAYGVNQNQVDKATSPGKFPEPASLMKQLPASTWEKMGLTIGGSGNTTNELIKKSNTYLKTIAEQMNPGRFGGGNSFGMTPATNNA